MNSFHTVVFLLPFLCVLCGECVSDPLIGFAVSVSIRMHAGRLPSLLAPESWRAFFLEAAQAILEIFRGQQPGLRQTEQRRSRSRTLTHPDARIPDGSTPRQRRLGAH